MRNVLAVLRFAFVSLPSWSVMLIIRLPLYLVGILLVAWQSKQVEVRPSRYFPNRRLLQFRARWMFIFGNEEDGVDGLRGGDPAQTWWAEKTEDCSTRGRIFMWSALRNPVNNIRYVSVLNPRFNPQKIRYIGTDHEPVAGERGWFFIWQGLYSAFRLETGRRRVWVGWKLRPEDTLGIDPTDTRRPLADFALQFKRTVKDGGAT